MILRFINTSSVCDALALYKWVFPFYLHIGFWVIIFTDLLLHLLLLLRNLMLKN